jgi:hypothetical protein
MAILDTLLSIEGKLAAQTARKADSAATLWRASNTSIGHNGRWLCRESILPAESALNNRQVLR